PRLRAGCWYNCTAVAGPLCATLTRASPTNSVDAALTWVWRAYAHLRTVAEVPFLAEATSLPIIRLGFPPDMAFAFRRSHFYRGGITWIDAAIENLVLRSSIHVVNHDEQGHRRQRLVILDRDIERRCR